MIIKRKTKSVSDLFYISSRPDLDGEYIKPKINLYPDVGSALSGISAVPGEDTNIEGATYYIYKPLMGRADSLIKPGIIESPKALVLPEYWYLQELRLRFIAAVKVLGREKLIGTYRTGTRQTPSRVYSWSWEEILGKYQKKGKLVNIQKEFGITI